jgi:predicted transcriptional regulator
VPVIAVVLLLAEHLNVSDVNPERKVTVAARVPPELADAVAALADAGDRTVSREVFRALREHVDRADVGASPSARTLAERRAPGDLLSAPAVEAQPLAGDEEPRP